MLRKNWRDYDVTGKVNTMENTSELYIVFEEDGVTPKNYDLCKGVFTDLEVAKEYANSIQAKQEEKVFVAKYDDYVDGNYDYL